MLQHEIDLYKAIIDDPKIDERVRNWHRAALQIDAEFAGKERTCPKCAHAFTSKFNRGKCPKCGCMFFASNPACGNKSLLRVPKVSLKAPPKSLQEHVDFYVREYGAGVSLLAYIAAEQDEYFPKLLPNVQQSHPEWTEEQRIAAGTDHLMCGEPLLWRGIAKRLADDDPAELARSASLYARLELWSGTRDERGSFLNFAHDMLRALAAGDTFVIRRFAAVAPQVATTGDWAARLIHNGVIAAINRDDELLAAAVQEFQRWKKPQKYISHIYIAINGLLKKDAALVDEGICEFLKNSRKLHQDDEILKVISLEAHGLYELCKWYDAELVDQFDCEQGLPWDKQLCDWVAESTDEFPFHDVSALSPVLQAWLTELPFRDGLRHDWT